MEQSSLRRVVVSPYDERWPEVYAAERARLGELMGTALLAIHHIGSTSVQGLSAKPVIDILGEAAGLELIDDLTPRLEASGLEARGEYGVAGRRYFVGYTASGHRLHLHVFRRGHRGIGRHLLFRDYLRAHRRVARQYGQLKRTVAAKFARDPDAYQRCKATEIEDILAKAEAWDRGGRGS